MISSTRKEAGRDIMKKLIKEGKLELWRKHCQYMKEKHPLSCLSWETTIRCNLSCEHCGSFCSPEEKKEDELSTKEIKKALKTVAEDFNPKKIFIAVTGGEPLLREDLFDVMEDASSMGFPWGMVTNGTLITRDTVEKMKKSGMNTVSVSIDGTEKEHDKIRGEGIFKRATEGVKMLVESKYFEEVEIITCINSKNIDELDDMHSMFLDLGVDSWRVFTVAPIGRARSNKDLFLTSKQYVYVLDYIKNKKRDKKNKLPINFCDEGFLGLDYEGEARDPLFFCWAGVTVGSILYNGDVAGCAIIPRKHTTQGNIRKERFSEIWNSKFEMFRNREWKKKGKCKECYYWDYCEGESMHLWDFEKKELKLCNYKRLEEERPDDLF